MCLHICVYKSVCECVYIHACTCVYMCMCMCVYIHMSVHVHVWVCVCMCVHVCFSPLTVEYQLCWSVKSSSQWHSLVGPLLSLSPHQTGNSFQTYLLSRTFILCLFSSGLAQNVVFDLLPIKNKYLYIVVSYTKCLMCDHFLTYKTGSFSWSELIRTKNGIVHACAKKQWGPQHCPSLVQFYSQECLTLPHNLRSLRSTATSSSTSGLSLQWGSVAPWAPGEVGYTAWAPMSYGGCACCSGCRGPTWLWHFSVTTLRAPQPLHSSLLLVKPQGKGFMIWGEWLGVF